MLEKTATIRFVFYRYDLNTNYDKNLFCPFEIFIDDKLVLDKTLGCTIKPGSDPIINVTTGTEHTLTVKLKETDVVKKIKRVFNKNATLVIFYDLNAKDLVIKIIPDKVKIKIDFSNEICFQFEDSIKIFLDNELVFDKISLNKNQNNKIQEHSSQPVLILELKQGEHCIAVKSKKNKITKKIKRIFHRNGTLYISYAEKDTKSGKKQLIVDFNY
ncbi:hypothetical protein KAI68_04835 [bacterium]|nr:hypothetical protein [bacterium]